MANMYSILSGWAQSDGTGSTTPRYNYPYGQLPGWTTTEANAQFVIPYACTEDQLYWGRDIALGAGNTVTLTRRRNSSGTSLTATLTNTTNPVTNNSDSVSYVQGDLFCMEWVGSGSISGSLYSRYRTRITMDGGFPVMTRANITSAASTIYTALQFSGGATGTTENDFSAPMPSGGTISNLTINVTTAPGSGKSVTFTLMKNGSAQSFAVTVANTDTTGTNNSDSISFSAGDVLSWRVTFTSSPTAPGVSMISARILPTTLGDSFYTWAVNSNISPDEVHMAVTAFTMNAAQPIEYNPLPSMTAKAVYAKTSTDSGDTTDFQLQSNGGGFAGGVDVSVISPDEIAGVTGLNIALPEALYRWKLFANSSPNPVKPAIGLLVFLTPPSTPTGTGFFMAGFT